MRMTPEEFQAAQDRINAIWAARVNSVRSIEPGQVFKVTKTAGKRNLYGAQKVEIDGIKFDSQAEGKRYIQLKALEKAGEIVDLRIQVEFQILPAQDKFGKKERPVKYVCDFSYRDRNGVHVVEDVKSAPTKTREYIIKRKMLLFFHGIIVREVLMQ